MKHNHRITGWLRLEGTSRGHRVLPPAPVGPLKLPAAQLLVGILSLQDFILYLKPEIQNVAAKIQNLPNCKPLLCSLLEAGKSF